MSEASRRSSTTWRGVPVLVTGGDGFIGANLVRRLLTLGAVVHALRRRTTGPRLAALAGRFASHEADLTDAARVTAIMREVAPRAVFHLAAYGTAADQTDPQQLIRTNVEGTMTLVRALEGLPDATFVNTGSMSEYDASPRPLRETHLLRPGTLYGASKAAASLFCAAAATTSPHQIVTLRPFHVYGPFDDPRRLVPTAVRACLNGQPLRLVSGVSRRDFVYVEDVVDAYLRAAEPREGLSGETFNVASGRQHSLAEAVRLLGRLSGEGLKVLRGGFPPRPWDRREWVADVGKARRRLGWRATTSLHDGLALTLAWHRAGAGGLEPW